eukprot:Skav228374  [mRNA]  locus=scaffold1981:266569:268374:+ [translate_table: standard]
MFRGFLGPGNPLAIPQANGDMRSFLRREVETVAASIPQQAASPPVQLIIQSLGAVRMHAWYRLLRPLDLPRQIAVPW